MKSEVLDTNPKDRQIDQHSILCLQAHGMKAGNAKPAHSLAGLKLQGLRAVAKAKVGGALHDMNGVGRQLWFFHAPKQSSHSNQLKQTVQA